MKKIAFVLFCGICGIFVLVGFLCGCFGTKRKEVELNESPLLVEQQIQQIKAMYSENKDLLIELQKLAKKEELSNASIKNDGYFVLRDKRTLWIENISERVKILFATENEESISIGIRSDVESINPTPHIEIEIYYPENQMMYTLVYCEFDLTIKDDWYRCLDNNWYLRVAGMV